MDLSGQNKRYDDLARKLVDGTISATEKQEYLDWLNQQERDTLQIPSDFASDRLELENRIFDKLTHHIGGDLSERPSARTPLVRLFANKALRYAAVAMLLIATTIAFVVFSGRRIAGPDIAENTSSRIVPGKETAILTLADGSTILLDSAADGMLARQGNAAIVKLAGGQIAYQVNGNEQGNVLMNTVTTPKGGKYQVVLPDGTKVWLNAASSISYPVAFGVTKRNVTIYGEAYFEVAQDKSTPFTVDVHGRSSVQVLGTSFNINSYADEGSIRTTLIDGRIKVNASVILQPGQQSVQAKDNSAISLVPAADLAQVMAWKNGLFNFDRADIQTVMRSIERWYDVDVVYEGEIPSDHLLGRIPMNTSIDRVLNILAEIGIKFRIEGKKIMVTK